MTCLQTDKARPPPLIISTIRVGQEGEVKLLNFSFETNPPADPGGDLDADKGSLYDRHLVLHTSPLEIIYPTKTIFGLREVFKSPEEMKIDYLQESAIDSIKEYKDVKMSQLGWEFARENYVFFKLHIDLASSYFVFPMRGEYREGCSCLIANLVGVSIKSNELEDLITIHILFIESK